MNKDDFRDRVIIGIGFWAIADALDFITWGPLDMIGDVFSFLLRLFLPIPF